LKKTKCPCCGYFTHEKGYELFEICQVCFWQYDEVAHDNPDRTIGANSVSLNQAKDTYKDFGVSELMFKKNVRHPTPEEFPNNNKEYP